MKIFLDGELALIHEINVDELEKWASFSDLTMSKHPRSRLGTMEEAVYTGLESFISVNDFPRNLDPEGCDIAIHMFIAWILREDTTITEIHYTSLDDDHVGWEVKKAA